MRGKWILFGGVTILAAIAAGTLAVYRQHAKPAAAAQEAAKPAAAAVAPGPEITLQGRIQAQKVVNVAAPIEGAVESFSVDVGDDVAEGQVLARIKNMKLENNIEAATAEMDKAQGRVQDAESGIVAARLEASRARADAGRAKSEYDRADKAFARQKMLYAEGATARLVYEKAQREYGTAKDENESKEQIARQAEERVTALNRDLDTFKRMLADRAQALEQAKGDVAAGEVRSPVDGVIVGRRGQAGEDVNRTMDDLFKIATALSAMEVVVEPTPPQLQRIKAGQPAAIHIAELPNESVSGAVREVSGNLVIIDFISPTPLIKPGLTAQVTIKIT